MRHVEKALKKFKEQKPDLNLDFIKIENLKDEVGKAPVVSFTIQSDPISLVGVNGVQATEILEYSKFLFESLNDAFPCSENKETIEHINRALDFQKKRTKDRIKRGVEGKNEN